ncbi:MAG: undecaprenyl-diphosphate phosphatase [Bacteroidia bacterium]
MSVIQALILGIIQGLTEFLPVSSSGHIEIGKVLLGVQTTDNLAFSVLVHFATVLSTIVVFRKDLWGLIKGFFEFKWNEETQFIAKIVVSMIPVGIVGLLFKDELETLFEGKIIFVGAMLLFTAAILFLSSLVKVHDKKVNFPRALIIGLAQTIAILPGISRSGSTIGVALLLGVDKQRATRFSFLMVLLPILGATALEAKDLFDAPDPGSIGAAPLVAGFLAAFVAGMVACTWMITIVRRGKISWFGYYCAFVGIIAILGGLFL